MSEASAGWSSGWFLWPVRVYIEDVDAGGMVYHANHLKYAERARSEMLAAGGLRHAEVMRREGMIVVKGLGIQYHRPLRLEEEVLVKTRVIEMAAVSARLEQVFECTGECAGEMAARMEVELVYVNAQGRPSRWPEDVKAALRPG